MRYYDPSIARWTQRDSINNPLDEHGWNPYVYAGDDPINLTDTTGACWVCDVAVGALTVAAGASVVALGITHGAECLVAAGATSEAGVGIALAPLCVVIAGEAVGAGATGIGTGAYLIHKGLAERGHHRRPGITRCAMRSRYAC